MKNIVEFIEQRDGLTVAQKQIEDIRQAVEKLEYFPDRGNPLETKSGKAARYIIVDSYKVFYVVYNEHVSLQRVIHMRRNFKF